MVAVVVDSSVTTSNWSKAKPKDYKNADFDKALSAWETLAKKTFSEATKPSGKSIKGYETAITNAEALIKHLQECDVQLDKVMNVAKKASAELGKLADKLKGGEKDKYLDAASTASAIAAGAGSIKKNIA